MIGKFGIKALHPIWFALIREVVATPILCALAYFIELRPILKRGSSEAKLLPKWSDFSSFLILGLTGIYGNQLCFIFGLWTSPSITAAVIQPLAPIWTIIFALVLGIEVITINKIVGIAIAVLGSLVTLGFFNMTSAHLGAGTLFFLLNTACMGGYFLLQKPVLKRHGPITTTAAAYVCGASMMVGTTLIFWISGSLPPLTQESFNKGLLPLIYTVIGPSIGTYLLSAYANSKIDSTLVAAFKTLQPLSASLLAHSLLGEALLAQHAIGAFFLLFGMVVLVKESRPHVPPTPTKERTP